ncbi:MULTISPECIES: HIT family protein [Gordonia]|jgi:diadenosine tetraphosphate (Ap4A) HIT family hydrolase|uniref:HIT family hydrolase n=2 Tax=Gordonia alkanivorans TaxID=84096 RepID=W9DBV3_9ACTN|nr:MULTISPECIES: HIT family protein [Gordonia]AZZ79889.1 HIT family protein [Gordonia alkanivorans]ETA05872.1 HIT family hydrolase [Gordonia alkanivorans CGMCC 6845]MDH3005895.1 HIT family protein [Gordonia alkanivorans]MDH3013613.1 HIT family protein [Gordonia alkanivorans]MDH3016188.1 HIT family protein [Gordonia alkanivorans]
MASVFSMIINGDIPGRFVWKDGEAVAFLTIEPVTPGHVLVVPRNEVDHWEQMDSTLFAHLSGVAQKVGRAVKDAFDAPRIGLLIAGLEVPHVHIHVFQGLSLETFDLANANKNASPEDLDAAAEKIRASLRSLGYGEYVAD